jgi:hypothetical protein
MNQQCPFFAFHSPFILFGPSPSSPSFSNKNVWNKSQKTPPTSFCFWIFLVLCGQVAVDLSVLGSKSTPRRSSFSGSAVRRASTVGGFGFERRKSDAEWIFRRLGFGGLFNGAHDFMVILG